MSDLLDTLRSFVEERTPYNRHLGLRLTAVGPGEATCELPLTHAGAITALMDVTSGAAVCMKLGRLQGIATFELRIDSLRPASVGGVGRSLRARAHCYHLAGSTAFVRALAYDEDRETAVASAQGTFMLVDESS
jgi:acyl-coenzyme A thioesterase PaaI-like protein